MLTLGIYKVLEDKGCTFEEFNARVEKVMEEDPKNSYLIHQAFMAQKEKLK